MRHEFWQQRWQDGRIGFHLSVVNPWLIKYLPEFDLPANSKIFVPLCGKSLDLLYLVEKGFAPTGVEIAKQAVEEFFAHEKIQPKAESIENFVKYTHDSLTILHGDFFELTPNLLGKTDFVFDRASLIAMPGDMREEYVEKMFHIIGNCKQMLLVTMEYPQDVMDGPPFSVSSNKVKKSYADKFKIELLDEKDLTIEPKFADMEYALERVWKLTG